MTPFPNNNLSGGIPGMKGTWNSVRPPTNGGNATVEKYLRPSKVNPRNAMRVVHLEHAHFSQVKIDASSASDL